MEKENRIQRYQGEPVDGEVRFFYEGEVSGFSGEYLKVRYYWGEEKADFWIGIGKKESFGRIDCKEAFAKAVKEAKALERRRICLDLTKALERFGKDGVTDAVEGCMLGLYQPETFREKEKEEQIEIALFASREMDGDGSLDAWIREAKHLMEGVWFARHMVNRPGNKLTPEIFAGELKREAEGLPIQVDILEEQQIQRLGMEAFLAVGKSSANPPCLIVMRYRGDADSEENYGFIGKGVTCDTGGYCLKPAASMLGIKGDMAGAAAAAGALYAMAKNQVKANVTVVIPSCENRISRESFLPGDVIGSLSGKTIEIGNTDAEGRLILADAITYAIQNERVTKILDIATLTGAVVAMFGFTTAGVMCDDDAWYETFEAAVRHSAEQYSRLPIFKEYKKMVESKIADVRNLSNGGCASITAGIFLKTFASPLPWIHVDIAGTAWVDSPIWEFQSAGATGAGVTTLYYLGKEQENRR